MEARSIEVTKNAGQMFSDLRAIFDGVVVRCHGDPARNSRQSHVSLTSRPWKKGRQPGLIGDKLLINQLVDNKYSTNYSTSGNVFFQWGHVCLIT